MLSQQVLELCKDLLDGVEVGRVFGQEDQVRAGFADGGADALALVAAEVVDNHDIAGLERGNEKRFHVEEEALAIDRPVDEPGSIDAIVAERGKERHRVPMPVRSLRFQSLSSRAPAAQGRHVGLRPGLVDEDEPGRINAALIACPPSAPSSHVGTILLFGQKRFF